MLRTIWNSQTSLRKHLFLIIAPGIAVYMIATVMTLSHVIPLNLGLSIAIVGPILWMVVGTIISVLHD